MRTGRVESISSWKRAARGKLKSEQKTKKRERLSILDKYGINRYLKGQRWWWAECGPDGWMWAAGRMSHRPICTSPSSFFFFLLLTVLPLSSFLYYLFLLHPRPEFAKVLRFFSSSSFCLHDRLFSKEEGLDWQKMLEGSSPTPGARRLLVNHMNRRRVVVVVACSQRLLFFSSFLAFPFSGASRST